MKKCLPNYFGNHFAVEGTWFQSNPTVRNVPVTPTPSIFPKVLPYKWGGVLPCKWEAYCSTNGRRIAGFPFLRSLEARKVRRSKCGAYCRTNWRCAAVLLRQVVGVGVSETLPIQYAHYTHKNHPVLLTINPPSKNTYAKHS